MSSGEGSCARTRGWHGEYKNLQRFENRTSSSDQDMSFDFDSDKSEQSSDGGYASEPSEKDFSGLGKDLSVLKVSPKEASFMTAMEAKAGDMDISDEENDLADDYIKPEKPVGEKVLKDGEQTGTSLEDAKGRSGKHKDGHKRRDKDHTKGSKRKEKSKNKTSEKDKKDSKKKTENVGDKKSHERHKKSEKSQKWEREEDSDFYRKEKRRGGTSEREHFRGSRHDDADEYSDHELYRRERHWVPSKSNYHKSSSKFDREKDGKRARLDGDQRTANRVRSSSRSPRSNSHRGRSPSPHHKDKEERDRANHDITENDGSNRYRRSGLGGYSPRRRRSDAAIKTPSPPPRSPERKKPRAWDLPPVGMDSGVAAAMAAAHQAAAQQAAAFASVSSLVTANPALAAVSLTQATRNLRRLYIGNVPATVSDGELLEFINAAMLSVNANHLPGTKPCINCMVNVEKSYAFAEFLTSEDATAGLAFDGITLHGTTLKIRRPRDYIPPPNGGLDNASAVDMVSSVVPDSPQKVFVGGICKTLSSDKVKEIVTAFGQLKAYHWEVTIKNSHKEAFAFLEYLDPSVSIKACAGLNGMRLGNKVLTVVQATPNASLDPDGKEPPFYGIPEYARTLMQAPTRILELQNVISEAEALTLSEAELLEIEEDVRLECVRFGTVKSTHVVKPEGKSDQGTETEGMVFEDQENAGSLLQAGEAYMTEVDKTFAEYIASIGSEFLQAGGDCTKGLKAHTESITPQEASAVNFSASEVGVVPSSVAPSKLESEETALGNEAPQPKGAEDDNGTGELRNATTQRGTELAETMADGEERSTRTEHGMGKGELMADNGGLPSSSATSEVEDAALDVSGNLSSQAGDSDLGRVYIEFTREESTCKAAHALHGRLYGDRKVIAGYFPLKLYQKRFRKGLEPRTHEEKQSLALAAHEHLNTYIPDRD